MHDDVIERRSAARTRSTSFSSATATAVIIVVISSGIRAPSFRCLTHRQSRPVAHVLHQNYARFRSSEIWFCALPSGETFSPAERCTLILLVLHVVAVTLETFMRAVGVVKMIVGLLIRWAHFVVRMS